MNDFVKMITIHKPENNELEMTIILNDGTRQTYHSRVTPDLLRGDTLIIEFSEGTLYVDAGDEDGNNPN